MAMKDYPELKKLFDQLWEEKKELVEKAKPFRDEYDKIAKQISPFEVKQRELSKKFRSIEQPRMAELDQQLAAIAKATGGALLSQPPPESETETMTITKDDVAELKI
jgi:uncharacterized coiled-coil DUF342 family protein